MNRNDELKYKEMQSLIRNCKEIIEGSADEELLFNNANKPSERFPTRICLRELSKYLILEEMPIQIRNAHMIGDIHFHDADYAALGMTNCASSLIC